MNQEMSILRRLARAGGFAYRHWKFILIGVGAIAVTVVVVKWIL